MFKYDVVVVTTDKYTWALQPFAYLFNKYWSQNQHVTVVGFTKPSFALPYNYTFCSVAPEELPKDRWSDGLLRFLHHYDQKHFVLMLEDYWLRQMVEPHHVGLLIHYAQSRNNVARIDLTSDRQFAGGVKDIGKYMHFDMVETPYGTPYQISLQAGIWNRDLMIESLPPNISPWHWEMHHQTKYRVLGTKQRPVRYINAVRQGILDADQIDQLTEYDRSVVLGMIKSGAKIDAMVD
jgi:hypothetical protein